MNIDLSTNNRTAAPETYINEVLADGGIPVVSCPTRVTSSSFTIIDHISTYDSTHKINPAILKTDVSDHFLYFAT